MQPNNTAAPAATPDSAALAASPVTAATDPLLDRLMTRIDDLMDAVSADRIAEANLAQVTNALGTLIDRAERLRNRTADAATTNTNQLDSVLEAINLYVHDQDTLESIANHATRPHS